MFPRYVVQFAQLLSIPLSNIYYLFDTQCGLCPERDTPNHQKAAHSPGLPYACGVEGCDFHSDSLDVGAGSVAEHRARHHKDKGFTKTKFPCDKCPASYSRRGCLEKHDR